MLVLQYVGQEALWGEVTEAFNFHTKTVTHAHNVVPENEVCEL